MRWLIILLLTTLVLCGADRRRLMMQATPAAGGGGFSDPGDITGLVLDLRQGNDVEEANGDPAEDGDGVLNWLDHTSNNNDMLQASAGVRPTARTGYVEFPGTHYMVAQDSGSLDLTGDFSAVFRLRADSFGGVSTVIVKGNQDSSSGTTVNYFLRYNSSGNFLFVYHDGSGYHVWQSTTAFSTGVDYEVIFSFTFGTGASAALYVNGSGEAGSWTLGNGNAAVSANTQDFGLGVYQWEDTPAGYWAGRISNVLLYSVILTSQNRTDLFGWLQ